MFKKSKNLLTNADLSTYIDGTDVYNSIILDRLKSAEVVREFYTITTYEYRPDLIAQEIYGDPKYSAFLMLSCGLALEDLRKGVTLSVITPASLNSILSKIV